MSGKPTLPFTIFEKVELSTLDALPTSRVTTIVSEKVVQVSTVAIEESLDSIVKNISKIAQKSSEISIDGGLSIKSIEFSVVVGASGEVSILSALSANLEGKVGLTVKLER